MELSDLKLQTLGIVGKKEFGRILSIIDFGNVNYWYRKDRVGIDAAPLKDNQYLAVDLEKLHAFTKSFSYQARFYYGWHPRLTRSQHIVIKAGQVGFVKNTKHIQYIKHYLEQGEDAEDGVTIRSDIHGGSYIEMPKCNFDVEITLDAVRLMKDYDTLCIYSGDSDFVRLAQYLKKQGKEVIVIASGRVYHELKKVASLYINAQQIKASVVVVKQTKTAPLAGRGSDIESASGGQGEVSPSHSRE